MVPAPSWYDARDQRDFYAHLRLLVGNDRDLVPNTHSGQKGLSGDRICGSSSARYVDRTGSPGHAVQLIWREATMVLRILAVSVIATSLLAVAQQTEVNKTTAPQTSPASGK